jgi:hypothetical protein
LVTVLGRNDTYPSEAPMRTFRSAATRPAPVDRCTPMKVLGPRDFDVVLTYFDEGFVPLRIFHLCVALLPRSLSPQNH